MMVPADMNAEGARAKEKQSDELKSFQVGIELMKCVHFISAALDAATFAGSAAVVVAVIVFAGAYCCHTWAWEEHRK